MLRNDLKPLLGDNWRSKFVHRDLWDPEGYGVASFDLGGDRETALVINLATEDIMEYFFDDLPDDEWISLDRFFIKESFSENCSYYINSNYSVKNVNSGKITRLVMETRKFRKYPSKEMRVNNNRLVFYTHRLIAFIFVPNPKPDLYDVVNHIDSNKSNFSKENLEWCDTKWNNSNRLPTTKHAMWIRDDGEIFTVSRLKQEYKISDTYRLNLSIKKGTTYHSMWKHYDPVLEDYLSRHPIDPDGWYEDKIHTFKSHTVRVNSCGIVEIDGIMKVGHFEKSSCRYVVVIDGIRFFVHRFIYEVIKNVTIPKDLVIDHIDPITEKDCNNSINNLRLVTQKENMNNLTTVKNTSKKSVAQFSLTGKLINIYDSVRDACEANSLGRRRLEQACQGGILELGGFLWEYTENVANNKTKRTDYICYKFSSSGELVGSGKYFTDVWITKNKGESAKYLNTGMPAPDGFYYQQGDPWNMLYDPNNTKYIKKRSKITWRRGQS